MQQGEVRSCGLWAAAGGMGDQLIVLLHGLGATAAVWHGIIPILEQRNYRWLAPDFRGHGRSRSKGPYGFGNHAADIAELLSGEDLGKTILLAHSFGGVVGAALASGLFGPVPARMVAVGVKLQWSDHDVAGAKAMAERPKLSFPTREEAVERYLKVSGLTGLVEPNASETEGGTQLTGNGYALSMEPGVFSAVGPSVEDIIASAIVPIRLAAGSEDPMVSLTEMKRFDADAVTLQGLPHNAHVVDPTSVVDLLG